MVFSSMIFLWCFLPLALVVYYLLGARWRNGFLLIASLLFYAWGEPRYIWLMLFSIFINYFFGIGVDATSGKIKKVVVICDIISNISLLGYFKYTNFFVETVEQVIPNSFEKFSAIALPIGISFYTFQAMSYVIDVYRSDCKVQKNPLLLGLYISFFPQLIAGPIIKYHDVEDRLLNRQTTSADIAYGIKRFILGLSKKVLIANPLAMAADNLFTINPDALGIRLAWFGAICYTFQIYYDFSGYSDMAIGLGRMFGFRFLENFNYPYLSKSIIEFWRRWHISLSTWFKEYVYIPLGGNRKGEMHTLMNLMIVFLVTGIWHGAAWTFLLWGIYHGAFIIFEKVFLKKYLDRPFWKIPAHLYTCLVFVIGWVFFRADTLHGGFQYLRAMLTPKDSPYQFAAFGTPYMLSILLTAFLFCGPVQRCFPRFRELLYDDSKTLTWELIILPLLLILCIVYLISSTYNPFIYFRF